MAPRKTAKISTGPTVDLPNNWKLGTKLGEGAQGSVFAVVDKTSRKQTEWAVKITKAPPPGKTKAKPKTEAAKLILANACSLRNEGQLYNAHLLPLRGTIVPNIPLGFPGVRESNGHLFLFMERMECDLLGKLPELVSSNNNIPVGPMAERMVALIEGIHKVRQLVIDVKPENFMFAPTKTKKKTSSPSQQLRLVDFGLMRPFREQESLGAVQGNAMYASLHMHTLNTSSRRDDLEMVCYVIGEVLIRLQAMVDGTTQDYEQTEIPGYLPWSQEMSDEDVGEVKHANVMDLKSEFYRRMPKAAANQLHKCLQLLWGYNFNTEPEYQRIQRMLSSLVVPTSTTTRKRGIPTTSAEQEDRKPASGTKRTTRRAAGAAARADAVIDLQDSDEDDDEKGEESPAKYRVLRSGTKTKTFAAAATSTTAAKRATSKKSRTIATQTDPDEEDKKPSARSARRRKQSNSDEMDVDEVFHDAKEEQDGDGDDDDDVSMADVENQVNNSDKKESSASVKLVIVSVDHESEHYVAGSETVILGSKPMASAKKGKVSNKTLISVEGLDTNHVAVSLNVKRGRAVNAIVQDLNSSQGTQVAVDGSSKVKSVPKGGTANVLIPGEIFLGSQASGVTIFVTRK